MRTPYEYIIGIIIISLLILVGIAKGEEVDLNRIKIIESGGNALAHNKRSDARGLYQITGICLKEYNTFNKSRYTPDDLWRTDINAKIASWYLSVRIPAMLKYYGLADTVKNRIWAYNAGIGNVKKGIMPAETRAYIAKYEKMGG
jgi:soluble lytic murein transglycosylase-like protein